MVADWRPKFESMCNSRDGRTLIVGSRIFPTREDRRLRYADAVGIDADIGPGVDVVHDMESPLPAELKFAHVECTSVLEHCPRPWKVAAVIEDAMIQGGTLLLSVPFVWRWHGYPSDYFRFTADGVRVLFPRIEWDLLMYAGETLTEDHDLQVRDQEKHRFLPRCEVYGFGRRV